MANTRIQLHSSGTTTNQPSLGVLANGEIALNFADGIIYYKTDANALGEIKTTTPSGLDTEIQFNDGGDFGGNSYLTFAKSTSVMTLRSDDAGSSAGPEFEFYRNSASPADADYLGQIKFQGENDAGAKKVYAKVTGKISDASDTTEDGLLEFANMKAGSLNIGARLTSTELKLINGTGLEVAGLTYPTSDGSANQVLTTNGSGTLSFADAGGGITGFTAADNTSSPNDTVNAASLTSASSSTNADIVLEPKGTGAFLSHIPGGDAATGNKRGAFAIDLQLNRTDGTPDAGDVPSIYMGTIISGHGNSMGVTGTATTGSTSSTVFNNAIISARDSSITSDNSGGQVHDAVIIGGNTNTISNNGTSDSYQAAILGGYGNTLTGWRSTILGGYSHLISNWYSSIVGGYDSTISGQYGGILSGRYQTIDSTSLDSVIAGGTNNEIEGDTSFIGGGYSHFIDDGCQYGAIVGGYNHTLDGDYAGMFAGRDNAMTSTNSQYSVILGGYLNTIAGNYSAILSGVSSDITGNQAAIIGGYDNHVSAGYSVVVGGRDNDIDGVGSVALGGYHAYDHGKNASVIMPAGISGSNWDDGEAQQKYNTVAHETTDATQTVLNTQAGSISTAYFAGSLNSNGASLFKITLIANVTGGGDTKAWTFEGVFKKGSLASSVAFVGTPVKNVIAEDTGAADWDADVQVNTTYGGVEVACTGAASTTIRWVAQISQTQVAF